MHDLKDLDFFFFFFQKETIFSWGAATFTPEMPHLSIHAQMQTNRLAAAVYAAMNTASDCGYSAY